MTPPELAGNTPITYVFDPVQVGLLKTVRHEINAFPGLLRFDRRFSEWLHFDEPLGGQIRFNNRTGPLAMADLMQVILDFN
ncbi:hypothetical protein D3C81_1625640 [compost metagenome]